MSLGSFELRERDDPDGALRVMLVGEIDMGAAEDLGEGLARLKPSGRLVRLDLSELEFIDCCGLKAVLAALADARTAGCNLAVDRQVSGDVGRMVDLADVAALLWPRDAAPVLA